MLHIIPVTFWIYIDDSDDSDDIELLKEMVKRGKDCMLDPYNKDLVLSLIELGCTHAASELIEAGGYISEYDINYMIKLAKRKGYNDIVEKLVKRKEEMEIEKLKDD